MLTKHLCDLIHIRNKGEVPSNTFKPSSNFFTDRSNAVRLSVDFFCYLCFVFVFVKLSCLFLAALRSPAGKGLTSWLSGI